MSKGNEHAPAKAGWSNGAKTGGVILLSATALGAMYVVDQTARFDSRFFTPSPLSKSRIGELAKVNEQIAPLNALYENSQAIQIATTDIPDEEGVFPQDVLGIASNSQYDFAHPLRRAEDPHCITNVPDGSITICDKRLDESIAPTDPDTHPLESTNPVMHTEFNGHAGTIFLAAGHYTDATGAENSIVTQSTHPLTGESPPLPTYALPVGGAGLLGLVLAGAVLARKLHKK
ncbi:MAG: hypothetical protein WCO78_03555 [Candidatus Roizmanbacteria bacterium]